MNVATTACNKTSNTNQLLFQEDFLCIYYNSTHQWLYAEWRGNMSNENIKTGLEFLIQLVKTKKCRKFINNSLKITTYWSDLVDWVTFNVIPRLSEAGIDYVAWIYTDATHTKELADKVLQQQESDILIIVFDTVKMAEKWLRSVR